jgi:SAM-dependent methyltransferase
MSSPFDGFSKDYGKAIGHPVRSLLESDGHNEFLRAKAAGIVDWWDRTGRPVPRVLDFGCGTGLLTKYLHDLRPDWQYFMADPSAGMLAVARETAPFAACGVLEGETMPFDVAGFDLVLMSGVVHHVPESEWPEMFARVLGALGPDGRLLVFEHNPWNPLTQLVVRTTPVDRDATMHSAAHVIEALVRGGFAIESRRYIHFFPPRFDAGRRLERGLGWLPLGTQYFVRATRATVGRSA